MAASRSRGLAAAFATLVTILTGITGPSSYGAAPPEPDPAAPAPPATVTLLTGDRVTLVPSVTGEPQVRVGAGDYSIRRDGDRIEVIPRDLVELVPQVLDPALFDVTALAAMGYDDAGSTAIPLILRRGPGERTLRLDPALRRQQSLPSIRAVAVRLAKARAVELGDDLVALAAQPGRATRADAADALGGVDRIWLDAQVTAASAPAPPCLRTTSLSTSAAAELDPYLTQIGAPEAWATGLDGDGVTVAVLDSGIDEGHPALAGQVTAEHNFTDAATADDLVGHGTHVASLLAGTGAGSDGARQGVAPAADLLSGKVLGDAGEGQLSWVIDGMEWAVAQGADVVNMSLAARAGPTDDPVVLALEALTHDSGTLFVVAAGNAGWNGWVPETVTSPGTAPSALTVGAVTGDDVVPGFSGQGPTPGSYRAKPDVVAPGVDILGARAGARVQDLYVPETGTSMATPLVAGAAALVLQEHPEWSWEQVKSAVAASADHVEPAWSAGAGRLALERMVEVTTTASPTTISPGPSLHPAESPLTTTVTLTNTGAEARTYTVTDSETAPLDGTAASDATVVASPASVTVPPGATATFDVAFDPGEVADGYWHGYVDLTGDDGSELRLPFASYDEPERYPLDVTVLDRTGAPYAGGEVPLLNLDNGYFYTARLDETGHAQLRVAPGTYSAIAIIGTGATTTVAGTPALSVTEATTLAIDARDGRRLRPPVVEGRRTRATEVSMVWNTTTPEGIGYGDVLAPAIDDVLAGRVYVAPSVRGSDGTFRAAVRWRLEPRRAGSGPDGYELVFAGDRLPDPAARVLGPGDVRRLAVVTERTYAPEQGDRVLRGLVSSAAGTFEIIHRRRFRAPRTETVLMTAADQVGWAWDSNWLDERGMRLFSPLATPFPPRTRTTLHFRRGLHVGVPAGSAQHGEFGMFVEQGFSDGARGGQLPVEAVESASIALYADGELVSRNPDVFGWFDVPPELTSYRLVGRVDLVHGPTTRTTWGFRSEQPDPAVGGGIPPLLEVDYGPSVSLLGTARKGRDLRFDLALTHLAGSEASPRIDDAGLRWSVDGGTTWRRISLRRTGRATFTAVIDGRLLQRGRAVSVRFRGADADGNTIDQQVVGLVPLR